MIGSYLYLTASRPEIVFSVRLYARLQSAPRESHVTAVKRILSDADYAKDRIERKSTSGGYHFLEDALVS